MNIRDEYEKYKTDHNGNTNNIGRDFRKLKREIFDEVYRLTSFLPEKFNFRIRLWYVFNDIHDILKCPKCNQDNLRTTGIDEIEGYNKHPWYKYCRKCERSSEEFIDHMKELTGGYINVSQIPKVKENKVITCRKTHGCDNPSQSKEVQEIKKENCRNLRGYDSPSQDPVVKQKHKNTVKQVYHVDNISQIPEVKEKKKETSRKNNNGYDYWSQNPDNKQLISQINKDNAVTRMNHSREHSLQIRGVPHHMMTDEYKNIFKELNREKSYEKLLQSEFIEPLFSKEEWLINPDVLFKWKCKKCNKIFIASRNLNFRISTPFYAMCPDCYSLKGINKSKYEFEIKDYIETIYKGIIDINTKHIISPYELDLYIVEKKIAFEFDGLYWHSSKYKNSDYHITKTKECESKDIRLFHIFEDEWVYEKEFIKDRIRYLLENDNQFEVSIKEIASEDLLKFDNHFLIDQMFKYYGIYKEHELVGCFDAFIFGDTIIISRLIFKYQNKNLYKEILDFIKKQFIAIKNVSIIVDRRWPEESKHLIDNFFIKNGETDPSCWISEHCKRQYDFLCKKDIDEYPKELITYDCGKENYLLKLG